MLHYGLTFKDWDDLKGRFQSIVQEARIDDTIRIVIADVVGRKRVDSGLNQDFLDLVTIFYDICNNFKFGILERYLNFKTLAR